VTDQHGPLEFRAAGDVTDVSFPHRTIDLIVMPYEQPAVVEHHGRMIQEIVSPGAFDGIERRANRVRVNYHHQDHELRHQLGRAIAFYPATPEGLVARLRIGKGETGDLALAKAADGDLGASAGFGVMDGGETWPTLEMRRLTRLFLDHVALTPTPAYVGAEVLAVRSDGMPAERTPTPNLDQVRAWRLAERYDSVGR
jgi:HK97 family phage prohead protease